MGAYQSCCTQRELKQQEYKEQQIKNLSDGLNKRKKPQDSDQNLNLESPGKQTVNPYSKLDDNQNKNIIFSQSIETNFSNSKNTPISNNKQILKQINPFDQKNSQGQQINENKKNKMQSDQEIQTYDYLLNFNSDQSQIICNMQNSCKIIETNADSSYLEERWVQMTENYFRIFDEFANFQLNSNPKIQIPIQAIQEIHETIDTSILDLEIDHESLLAIRLKKNFLSFYLQPIYSSNNLDDEALKQLKEMSLQPDQSLETFINCYLFYEQKLFLQKNAQNYPEFYEFDNESFDQKDVLKEYILNKILMFQFDNQTDKQEFLQAFNQMKNCQIKKNESQ